jgi:hypothetical protein
VVLAAVLPSPDESSAAVGEELAELSDAEGSVHQHIDALSLQIAQEAMARHSYNPPVSSGRSCAQGRRMLDSIDVSTHAGLRDRALIGLMVYSLARIRAALGMAVEDVYTQNRRLWVRLREKGGKRHAMPCHHNLDEYLTAYLDGAGLRDDPKGPLFRTIGRGTGKLTRTVLPQANAYAMIRRRATAAGIATRLGNHSLQGNGDHRLSQERRYARKGRRDGKPCLDAHDAALRSAAATRLASMKSSGL